MKYIYTFDKHLEEGARYDGPPTERTRDVLSDFRNTVSGEDLFAIGVRAIPEIDKVRLERRGFHQSMPRTGVYKGDDGKIHVEHYSSKPGLEIYGQKSFDNTEDAFRHIWMRIAKNLVPASLVSRREAEKRIDLEALFPPGSKVSQDEFYAKIKPYTGGGEELANPSNQELLETDTIQKLLELGLVGKLAGRGLKDTILIEEISRRGQIKYKFFCTASKEISKIYSSIVSEILGEDVYNSCYGTMKDTSDYERWTVTNTNRLPINSVNFRTGESTLRCHVETNEMTSAVFLAIIKRTFKRAKGKVESEKILVGNFDPLVGELNSLLSDYFFEAASELRPSVFLEEDFRSDPSILKNAHALLLRYLIKNGSEELVERIKSIQNLEPLIKMSTSEVDLDSVSRKLIKAARALQYV